MKFKGTIFALTLLILTACFSGCSSAKEASQRRNLMIPQKSELPRNSKYADSKKKKKMKKNYKPKKKKSKR